MDNMKDYIFTFSTKPIAIKAGKNICLMNEADVREMGLNPFERVQLINPKNNKKIVTVIDISQNKLLKEKEIGLFFDVQEKLGIKKGTQQIKATPMGRPKSIEYIKKKMNKKKLTFEEMQAIVQDISENKLSEIEVSAFVSSVYINGFDLEETVSMTKALIGSGQKLVIPGTVVDKHSIGGVNGRVTMVLVPIIAEAGLKIPKTSSRSITSAAGTADAMEVLANVSLTIAQIKKITQKIGGVIAWGGAVELAPADDKIIKIEHPLSLDPEGQVIASVMAKKESVSSKFVVIDLPVGKEVKVKTREQATSMAKKFIEVGKAVDIKVEALITNGDEPSGPAFGPALEARHALEVLEGKVFDNMAQKAVELAGTLLELSEKAPKEKGYLKAKEILESGKALKKMKEIINAQGKKIDESKKVPWAKFSHDVKSTQAGSISQLDVKGLTLMARIAGAPVDKEAGVLLNSEEGQKIKKGDKLMTIYSNNKRRLEAARDYLHKNPIIQMERVILEKIE
jgi:AMP phosphorylase